MKLEQRLRNTLAEAERDLAITIDDDPTRLMRDPSQLPRVASLAAMALIAAVGLGSWFLIAERSTATETAAAIPSATPTSEAVSPATEPPLDPSAPDDAASPASQPTSEAAAVAPTAPASPVATPIGYRDITSATSPGGGTTVIDGDTYYVLSNRPGDPGGVSDDIALNTFYVFDEASGWTVAPAVDRPVTSFDVVNGTIYVASLAPGGDVSVGVSTDRAETWNWAEAEVLDGAISVTLVVNEEAVLLAADAPSRFVGDARQRAFEAANFDQGSYYGVPYKVVGDSDKGLWHYEETAENWCLAVESQLIRSYVSHRSYQAGWGGWEDYELPTEKLVEATEALEAADCAVPDDLAETMSAASTINSPLPEPTFTGWEELGVAVPEELRAWIRVVQVDTTTGLPVVTEADTPFGSIDSGWPSRFDGQMVVRELGFTPRNDVHDFGYPSATYFITSDGLTWTEETEVFDASTQVISPTRRLLGAGYQYTEALRPATAGLYEFRLEMEDPNTFSQTRSKVLQRRQLPDGEWTDVPFENLFGDIDPQGRVLRRLHVTDGLGVFAELGYEATPTGRDITTFALHSSDGETWTQTEMTGRSLEVSASDGKAIMFAQAEPRRDDLPFAAAQSYLVVAEE